MIGGYYPREGTFNSGHYYEISRGVVMHAFMHVWVPHADAAESCAATITSEISDALRYEMRP